jgi:methylmalonyl-CoA/ethylmalonyl-CoA epimerase
MITHIDHLGIAVEDLESTISIYRDLLGLPMVGTDEVPEQKVKVAMFKVGESKIELLESTDPEGPIGKHIEKKGQGIHHIAFHTDDIEADLENMKQQGARLINETPVSGAHGTKVAFIHPKSSGKVLMELCQPGEDH